MYNPIQQIYECHCHDNNNIMMECCVIVRPEIDNRLPLSTQ